MKIISYLTPQDFLYSTLHLLEQKEVENNLIIGLSTNLIQSNRSTEGCVFINAIDDDGIIHGSSIKTLHKAIVTGYSDRLDSMTVLSDYYSNNKIQLRGVVGKTLYAEAFATSYGKEFSTYKGLIVHVLENLLPIPLSEGKLIQASLDDIALVTEWSLEFENDAHAYPKTSVQDMKVGVTKRIESGSFYKWVVNERTVSIAAIVRTTTNACIVGVVYTPKESRGKGYASSCVYALSELILKRGYRNCGLFTDKDNPTSNNIYKKIGYIPIEEHSDIEFSE